MIQPVRILLVAIPPMLEDVVRQVVAEQTDMEIVGEVAGGVDVLLDAGQTGAELVIVVLGDSELPGVCSHLLDEYPHIKVLGLTRDGRSAFVYESRPQTVVSGEVSVQGLRNMIRSAFSSKFLPRGEVNDR